MGNRHQLYFDYQASTPVDPEVLEKMRPWQAESFGNPHSVDHIFGWQSAQAVETSAALLAAFVGSDPDEIVFTSGATEANNLALLGISRGAVEGKRPRILVSAIEHESVLAPCRILQARHGYRVEQLPVDSEGIIDIDAFGETVSDDVLLVSVMAVNNEIGSVQPIREIGTIAREHGAIFHSDAAQAACAVEMDTLATCVDLISLSAHKMYGPKGIGALCIRRDLQDNIEPLIYGGGQQNNIRSGTVPVPLCVGMAAAVELLGNDAAVRERKIVRSLRDRFVQRLKSAGIEFAINGPSGELCHPGNLSIRLCGHDAHELLGALQPHIAASIGSACASGAIEPSHVLRAIGLSESEAKSTIRFSLGRFSTAADVDGAISYLGKVVGCEEADPIRPDAARA